MVSALYLVRKSVLATYLFYSVLRGQTSNRTERNMLAFVLVAVVLVGVQLPVPAPTNLKVEHRAASPEDDRYYAPPGNIIFLYR